GSIATRVVHGDVVGHLRTGRHAVDVVRLGDAQVRRAQRIGDRAVDVRTGGRAELGPFARIAGIGTGAGRQAGRGCPVVAAGDRGPVAGRQAIGAGAVGPDRLVEL